MAKIAPISGFPEHLPAAYLVEQELIEILRHTFMLHGYVGIETRAVEPLLQLLAKGETSKEVYLLNRLQDEGNAPKADNSRLGLHFDLTVPFARYVLENAGHLQFPFKRYQIQKVWRGERPQEGRFREFIQADIDVVGRDVLPAHYEVELPLVMADAFTKMSKLGVPPIKILVNNRKLSQGFYQGLGLTDIDAVLRCIDKLDKIGAEAVIELLGKEAGATPQQAQACIEMASINGNVEALAEAQAVAAKYQADSELFQEGLAQLQQLCVAAQARNPGVVEIDLKIARGLDYYTGSVYETVLVGHEDLGSICSGGRYDKLASDGKVSYPGVGMSVGVSRLVARLLKAGILGMSRPSPAAVLVAVTSEDNRAVSEQVAATLRAKDIPTEVAPTAAKYGKQIQYAEKRGIPFVFFPPDDEVTDSRVKDIRSGTQITTTAQEWEPPADDLWPQLVTNV
ncbi:MAG: histidine--tRNA ligase [Cellulomonadaceae bacterium]|jgi:histidyl-tRNA synthetase|nr:histidine--tRNA ligase [Cellulomonadaceae bacterium]